MPSTIARLTRLLFVILAASLLSPASALIDAGSCSSPFFLYKLVCRQREERILSATARIVIESWTVLPADSGYDIQYSTGHATVMDNRYLVTHNHFDLPINFLASEDDEISYGVIYLHDAGGELVFKGPLSDFSIVGEGMETLVLAHREEAFFGELGFASADLALWPSVTLQEGMEVAQIDWDGTTTHVDWVSVQEVRIDNETPRLVLSDGILPGASGGGIFRHGVHVANNWGLIMTIGEEGHVRETTSTAALNMASLLDFQVDAWQPDPRSVN